MKITVENKRLSSQNKEKPRTRRYKLNLTCLICDGDAHGNCLE